MKVVRHHYEVVHFELAGQGVCPKHVDKKLGFVLRLKKSSLHEGLTPGKKRPPAGDDIAPVRFSGELYHRQRLKPEFYYVLTGPAEARALIRTGAARRVCTRGKPLPLIPTDDTDLHGSD